MDELNFTDINTSPTANTTAEYPISLSDEIFKGEKLNFGGVPSVNKPALAVPVPQGPETVYIVCERPGFRADSFKKELSYDYNTKVIYLSDQKATITTPPLCFVIDVTSSLRSTYAKHMLECLEKYTTEKVIPLFLIGESEDLLNAKMSIPFPANAVIYEFERPINVKECIREIDRLLNDKDVTRKKKHILVVDDSITFLKLIQRILEKEYLVTVCQSAFDCITTLAKLSEMPDLLIIDQNMADCDGTTLTKMIRGAKIDVPIIFYTGNANVDNMIELMQMGIQDYLLKSQPAIEVRSTVDGILKNEGNQNIDDKKESYIRV